MAEDRYDVFLDEEDEEDDEVVELGTIGDMAGSDVLGLMEMVIKDLLQNDGETYVMGFMNRDKRLSMGFVPLRMLYDSASFGRSFSDFMDDIQEQFVGLSHRVDHISNNLDDAGSEWPHDLEGEKE